jgi:hypothetical protein
MTTLQQAICCECSDDIDEFCGHEVKDKLFCDEHCAEQYESHFVDGVWYEDPLSEGAIMTKNILGNNPQLVQQLAIAAGGMIENRPLLTLSQPYMETI